MALRSNWRDHNKRRNPTDLKIDYLHLTKRFGIIATSQMPIQYLLALKYLNPFAYVFASSHEQINRFHRVLGRIIYSLLILHALFYNVFFIESGIWQKRFFAPVVFAGVIALLGFHALSGTAMARVREWSYRVFFITHLVTAMAIPPLIYYHAHSARTYVLAALVVFVFDLAVRKMTTVTAPTTVEAIPGTNLLKISAKLHEATIGKYRSHPGSHIYMSVPPGSRPSSSLSGYLYEFLYSPFTVASVNEQNNELTLVARTRSGPLTQRLAHFAANPSSDNQISLGIEGPYGAVGKKFSELIRPGIDRVLLIAGGVGATFALPIYHAILEERPTSRVQLVWAIRSPGDATWATSAANGKRIIDDDGVHLFLTGEIGLSEESEPIDGVELSTLNESQQQLIPNKRRPDFQRIIDDTFRQGAQETVAVLVCGPVEMARDVRRRISPWVYEGRKVWWHNESFGW